MFKRILKRVLPLAIRRFLSGFFYGWHGNFSTWADASRRCEGYSSQDIIDKVKDSALKVKDGSVAYERDSYIFPEIQYSFPVLSSLLWIAAKNRGKLIVLDFGGSLGSTYYQNKKFLDSLPDVSWCVIEQPPLVKIGQEFFEDGRLHFFYSIEDCLKSFQVDVIILSSVLQYLEEPYKLLCQIKSFNIKHILIDRTPFIEGPDRITVQKVNPVIYKGSYPCWFFNKSKFISNFSLDYELIVEFDALDKANIRSEFKGMLLRKNGGKISNDVD